MTLNPNTFYIHCRNRPIQVTHAGKIAEINKMKSNVKTPNNSETLATKSVALKGVLLFKSNGPFFYHNNVIPQHLLLSPNLKPKCLL